MPRYVALLRAVNVGGRKVPMADLRSLLEELGMGGVTTYLQSGNAVFDATERSASKVASTLETAITDRFGFETPVIVTTPKAIGAAAKANPFLADGVDRKELHIAFLGGTPAKAAVSAFPAERFAPDELRVGKGVAYLRYANGVGRSKMTNSLIEKHLGVVATTRNWNTVEALAQA